MALQYFKLTSFVIADCCIAVSKSSWIEQEFADSGFKDARFGKRFGILLERLWRSVGESIPIACQDWANTKAVHRFLANDRETEADILAGHFQSTCERVAVTDGKVPVLQDTTEFNYE